MIFILKTWKNSKFRPPESLLGQIIMHLSNYFILKLIGILCVKDVKTRGFSFLQDNQWPLTSSSI